MYGKLFASMYEGTLYGHWQAIVTFQQMIALCGPDGVLDMTPHALAARTSIPLEIIEEGIKTLEEPDKWSRTPDHDGRRILRLDEHRPWGWQIVNYLKYRSLVDPETVRQQNKERQRRFRAARNGMSRSVTPDNGQSRQGEAEGEAIEEAAAPPCEGLNLEAWDRWKVYRSKIGKPIKGPSIPSAQRKLAAFGSKQAAVVENSIAESYQGLYESKSPSKSQKESGGWR